MSHDAGEVSWQSLRRIVQDWSGGRSDIEQVRSLDGGSTSTTVLLDTTGGERAVLKLSPHRVDRSYEREAAQLDLLRSLGLPAPRVLGMQVATLDRPDSYLLIEFLPGMNLHEARRQATPAEFDDLQRQFAEIVVALHGRTGSHYGKVEPADAAALSPEAPGDTATTATAASPKDGHASWAEFYRGLYDAIWRECEKHHAMSVKSRKLVSRVHDRLETLLAHTDAPRLTHGDLWWSNVLADRDSGTGRWRISGLLDPNCKYAHAESELAYLELFQTTTPAFTKAYQQTFRLPEEYHRLRKPIYQLYELINHVNLFGDRYLKPLQLTLDKLAPLV